MHRYIGSKPNNIIPSLKMTRGLLAMQSAESCRVVADLPIDGGHGSLDQVGVNHHIIFGEQFLLTRILKISGARTSSHPVDPRLTIRAAGNGCGPCLFELLIGYQPVITSVGARSFAYKQYRIFRVRMRPVCGVHYMAK